MAYYLPATTSLGNINYSNVIGNTSSLQYNETAVHCNPAGGNTIQNGIVGCLENTLYTNQKKIGDLQQVHSTNLGSGEIYEDNKKIYYNEYLKIANLAAGSIALIFLLLRTSSQQIPPP